MTLLCELYLPSTCLNQEVFKFFTLSGMVTLTSGPTLDAKLRITPFESATIAMVKVKT